MFEIVLGLDLDKSICDCFVVESKKGVESVLCFAVIAGVLGSGCEERRFFVVELEEQKGVLFAEAFFVEVIVFGTVVWG